MFPLDPLDEDINPILDFSKKRAVPFGAALVNEICRGLVLEEKLHDLACSLADAGARAEDGSHTGLIEEVIVLGGDDTTGDNHDIFTAEFLEFFDNLRNKGLVTGCK